MLVLLHNTKMTAIVIVQSLPIQTNFWCSQGNQPYEGIKKKFEHPEILNITIFPTNLLAPKLPLKHRKSALVIWYKKVCKISLRLKHNDQNAIWKNNVLVQNGFAKAVMRVKVKVKVKRNFF